MLSLIILIYINTYKAVIFLLFKSGTSTILFFKKMRVVTIFRKVAFGSGESACLGTDACFPPPPHASLTSTPPHSAHTWNGGKKKKRKITRNPHKNSKVAWRFVFSAPFFFISIICWYVLRSDPRGSPISNGLHFVSYPNPDPSQISPTQQYVKQYITFFLLHLNCKNMETFWK